MSNATLLEQYRPALTGHCYRVLGSVVDAEDVVQGALLRQQSSLKTWRHSHEEKHDGE